MSKLPAKLRASLSDRFWSHVEKGDGCWLWTGTTGGSGKQAYGKISRGRRGEGRVHAHRLSWEIAYGAVPEGMWVLHHCDTPRCVRPDHLFLGTQTDNMADARSKGRFPTGERHWGHRLTEDDVARIRVLHKSGALLKDIAARFDVSRATIGDIISGRTWCTDAKNRQACRDYALSFDA